MASAKISIPGGISVDINGTPDEIVALVENLKSKQTAVGSGAALHRGLGKSREKLSDLVESLKAESFFKTPRGLSDLQKKLAEIGHHYPLTTLSGAMQSQSRKRNLRRFKRDGKYVYVQ
jgi:superfamily II DNA/RNA helicase